MTNISERHELDDAIFSHLIYHSCILPLDHSYIEYYGQLQVACTRVHWLCINDKDNFYHNVDRLSMSIHHQ